MKIKSLLTHWGGHQDHLHINFNKTNNLGFVEHISLDRLDLSLIKLDSLKFEVRNNKLEVSPRNLSHYNKKTILWRLQDRKGFLDPNARIGYGRWINEKVIFNPNFPSFNEINTYWLYVTVGDTETGQCVQYEATIRLSDNNTILIQD